MIKRLTLLVLAAVLALAIAWISNQPGVLTLAWYDWTVSVHLGWALAGVSALLCAPFILVWLYTFIWYRSGLFGDSAALRRGKAAEMTATHGLAELFLNQQERAQALAAKALRSMPEDPLALFVAARLGDQEATERLARSSKTERLAAIAAHLYKPGSSSALHLAMLAPDSAAAWSAAFAEQARSGFWDEAFKALEHWQAIDKSSKNRIEQARAAVATAASYAAIDKEGALDWAQIAVKSDPLFAPGVVRAASLLMMKGKESKAKKLIDAAWIKAPHPMLAEAYAELAPLETAGERLVRFKALADLCPDHPESRYRVAEAALGAGEAMQALEAVGPLLVSGAQTSARAARLAAEAHRLLGYGADPHSEWPDALLHGLGEPDWQCSVCFAHTPAWALSCFSCGSIATLKWSSPTREGNHVAWISG